MKHFEYAGVKLVLPRSLPPIFQGEQRLMNTRKVLAGRSCTFEEVKKIESEILAAEIQAEKSNG